VLLIKNKLEKDFDLKVRVRYFLVVSKQFFGNFFLGGGGVLFIKFFGIFFKFFGNSLGILREFFEILWQFFVMDVFLDSSDFGFFWELFGNSLGNLSEFLGVVWLGASECVGVVFGRQRSEI
jgi:hypothetical protein